MPPRLGLTLRHACVDWDNGLVGPTWSNFVDAAALPESVDFIGVTDGIMFARQSRIRYTRGGFLFALEAAATTVTPFGAEVSHGKRDRQNGVDGDLSLVEIIVKYSF